MKESLQAENRGQVRVKNTKGLTLNQSLITCYFTLFLRSDKQDFAVSISCMPLYHARSSNVREQRTGIAATSKNGSCATNWRRLFQVFTKKCVKVISPGVFQPAACAIHQPISSTILQATFEQESASQLMSGIRAVRLNFWWNEFERFLFWLQTLSGASLPGHIAIDRRDIRRFFRRATPGPFYGIDSF
ncbi:MAG TPA: hypothetical protein VGV68_09015 [Terriglobia bacterium]|nr:hypothetical protein [Terriglobia bacterium]